jgi:hypothetical protein
MPIPLRKTFVGCALAALPFVKDGSMLSEEKGQEGLPTMELIDNINKTLKDDFATELRSGSKVAIAASCFSIYAFEELKAQLKDVEELRFIFTSPTFVTEKANKQKREFYIPRLNRERNLYGSEFEIKLRNELSQRAIARECAEWIRQKACFKSNRTGENMMGFATIDDKAYMPITGLPPLEWDVDVAVMPLR